MSSVLVKQLSTFTQWLPYLLYIRPRSSGTKQTASSLFSSLDLTGRVHACVSVTRFLPHPSRTFIHARGHRSGRFTKFKHERREKRSVSTWALFKYLSLRKCQVDICLVSRATQRITGQYTSTLLLQHDIQTPNSTFFCGSCLDENRRYSLLLNY